MIDSSKRKTLLSLSGMMALPFVPVVASANNDAVDQFNSALTLDSTEQLVSVTNGELDIELMFNDTPMMKVSNTTDTLTILRQIHPGIVHVGKKSYDLNKSLLSSAYAIGAGQSRLIPLIEAGDTTAESVLAARYGRKPVRAASIIGNDNLQSTSSRVLFS